MQRPGSLLVNVVDADGQPVPFARVSLKTTHGNRPFLRLVPGRTSKRGEIRFRALDPGSYRIQATHGRKRSLSVDVEVQSGRSVPARVEFRT